MPVAQHLLLVHSIALGLSVLTPAEERYELLHDAEEGFLGFDPITPIKALLGEPFHNLSDNITAAVHRRYQIDLPTGERHIRHKLADHIAAASEAIHVVGWSSAQVRNLLGIKAPILSKDPLHDRGTKEEGYAPWEPWESGYAAARFLEQLQLLLPSSQQEQP